MAGEPSRLDASRARSSGSSFGSPLPRVDAHAAIQQQRRDIPTCIIVSAGTRQAARNDNLQVRESTINYDNWFVRLTHLSAWPPFFLLLQRCRPDALLFAESLTAGHKYIAPRWTQPCIGIARFIARTYYELLQLRRVTRTTRMALFHTPDTFL